MRRSSRSNPLQAPLAPDHLVGERELDVGVVELLDIGALALAGGNGGVLDDGDGLVAHAVAGRHLLHSAAWHSRESALHHKLVVKQMLPHFTADVPNPHPTPKTP